MKQIVIEINEHDMEWIRNSYSIPKELNLTITEAILNGAPFDDIKTDLENYRAEQDTKTTFHFLRMKMCDDFANIINNHTGKELNK